MDHHRYMYSTHGQAGESSRHLDASQHAQEQHYPSIGSYRGNPEILAQYRHAMENDLAWQHEMRQQQLLEERIKEAEEATWVDRVDFSTTPFEQRIKRGIDKAMQHLSTTMRYLDAATNSRLYTALPDNKQESHDNLPDLESHMEFTEGIFNKFQNRKTQIEKDIRNLEQYEIDEDTRKELEVMKAELSHKERNYTEGVNGMHEGLQYNQNKNWIGWMCVGTLNRQDNRGNWLIDLGNKVEGMMPVSQQVLTERYHAGQPLRVFVHDVSRTQEDGPQIRFSRTHPDLVRRLFESEFPEYGLLEIKAVARDAGSLSKVAVACPEGLDPIELCTTGAGRSRLDNIVRELNNEIVRIIPWSSNRTKFVANSLGLKWRPKTILDETGTVASVYVPKDWQSSVVGLHGQNVRLAAELTGLDTIRVI